MPTTEIITIINNSGKVISTGKQLVSIFKEAKAAYRDKRESIKAERAERAGIQRAKTFDVNPRAIVEEYDEYEEEYIYERRAIRDIPERRRSQDDVSQASSHRSHRSRRTEARTAAPSRPALTMANLKTHSEVSATPPSTAPKNYRAPYAETAPRDMQLSRPTLAHAATMPLPARNDAPSTTSTTPVSTPRQSMLVHRPRSEQSLKKKKEVDMDLAYGNIPPDLQHRTDLDHGSREVPAGVGSGPGPDNKEEAEAMNMIQRIEGLLDEADCVQYTASSMIAHLQENPQAAAAVALTLAELSALIGKMSPAFLGVVKGSSPAIFALLASPQFLIGTSLAVGVTVIMFGGWKIVKRIRDANKEKEQAFEMQPMGVADAPGLPQPAAPSEASYEEALVLEEELSTIETWRRGIQPFGLEEDEESADVELMSPEADRALREQYYDEVDPEDSVSRVGSRRSHRSGRSHRSHRSRRHHRSHDDDEPDVPERRSSKKYNDDGGVSEVAASERSHRSHRSHRSSDSHTSRSSKRSSRTEVKTIEEVKEPEEKPRKSNMLKQLFKKKKDKEDKEKEKEGRAMSVMV